MSKIKIHAGDIPAHIRDVFVTKTAIKFHDPAGGGWLGKSIDYTKNQIVMLEVANEETIKTAGGTVGWGVVGATLLGPVGLLAGLLLGGKKNKVTFVARFSDGKKIMATVDNKTFVEMQALIF